MDPLAKRGEHRQIPGAGWALGVHKLVLYEPLGSTVPVLYRHLLCALQPASSSQSPSSLASCPCLTLV